VIMPSRKRAIISKDWDRCCSNNQANNGRHGRTTGSFLVTGHRRTVHRRLAASWALARRGVALSGAPLNFRFLGAATVIGIGGMLALIALGSLEEIIGLATLIGLSVLLYLIQARIALAKPLQ
jgi:hypothetical protein